MKEHSVKARDTFTAPIATVSVLTLALSLGACSSSESTASSRASGVASVVGRWAPTNAADLGQFSLCSDETYVFTTPCPSDGDDGNDEASHAAAGEGSVARLCVYRGNWRSQGFDGSTLHLESMGSTADFEIAAGTLTGAGDPRHPLFRQTRSGETSECSRSPRSSLTF
jgi:hypothetical protein